MKKEMWLIVGGIGAIALYYLLLRKKKKTLPVTIPDVKKEIKITGKEIHPESTEQHFRNAMIRMKNDFGMTKKEAELLEQQYRLETAHFKSGQFKRGLSAGMEKFGEAFPYGWVSLNKYFWKKYPEHAPTSSAVHTENATGKKKSYLVFPTMLSAALTTLNNARMKGGNFYAWFSNNPKSQLSYKSRMDKVIPRIAREIYD